MATMNKRLEKIEAWQKTAEGRNLVKRVERLETLCMVMIETLWPGLLKKLKKP